MRSQLCAREEDDATWCVPSRHMWRTDSLDEFAAAMGHIEEGTPQLYDSQLFFSSTWEKKQKIEGKTVMTHSERDAMGKGEAYSAWKRTKRGNVQYYNAFKTIL